MSLDASLKSASKLQAHRNVLTRAEKVQVLAGKKQFDLSKDNPLHLPKVGNRKVVTGGKSKKKGDEAEG